MPNVQRLHGNRKRSDRLMPNVQRLHGNRKRSDRLMPNAQRLHDNRKRRRWLRFEWRDNGLSTSVLPTALHTMDTSESMKGTAMAFPAG